MTPEILEIPEVRQRVSPLSVKEVEFGDVEATDSLINAAAAHHKPDTFLQWVVATADRVASGFEREEFDQYNDRQMVDPSAGF